MKKTIKWKSNGEERTLVLDNTHTWMLYYQEQFERDIVPDLVPVLNAAIEAFFSVLKQVDIVKVSKMPKERAAKEIFDKVDPEALRDAIIEASAIDATTLLRITWALAKTADEDIPDDLITWSRSLEDLTLDTIAGEVFALVFKAMLSGKNSKRLRGAISPGPKSH